MNKFPSRDGSRSSKKETSDGAQGRQLVTVGSAVFSGGVRSELSSASSRSRCLTLGTEDESTSDDDLDDLSSLTSDGSVDTDKDLTIRLLLGQLKLTQKRVTKEKGKNKVLRTENKTLKSRIDTPERAMDVNKARSQLDSPMSGSPDLGGWVSVSRDAVPAVTAQEPMELETEVTVLKQKLLELDKEKRHYETRCRQLMADFESMQPPAPPAAATSAQLQQRDEELRQARAEVALLKNRLKESELKTEAATQASVAQAGQSLRLEQLEAEVAALRAQLSERSSSEHHRARQLQEERDDALAQKMATSDENTQLKQQVSKLQNKLRAAALMARAQRTAKVGERKAAAFDVAHAGPISREQMPFNLRWTCKKCTFTNKRMISACEMCGEKTELPMYIDGYEVTTPAELRQRQAATKATIKDPYLILNPTGAD